MGLDKFERRSIINVVYKLFKQMQLDKAGVAAPGRICRCVHSMNWLLFRYRIAGSIHPTASPRPVRGLSGA
jgi:hypothetical protein